MSLILKPYEELVIASDRKIFLRIRLKLTALYLAVIACILFGYNTLNYIDLRHDIASAQYYQITDTEFKNVLGHAASLSILVKEMIIEDLIILMFAAWISYIFAGYTLKPAQRSLFIQKSFSENASHELRTPLAIMKSDIEVLLRNPHPDKDTITATLKSVVEEINRMTTMTNDLLLLARLEHEGITIQNPINIVQVTEHVVQKMMLLAQEKGIAMQFVSNRNVMTLYKGSVFALERALFNILQNAVTYTPSDGSIVVTLTEEKKSILLTVKDTGKGIAPKDLPYVFERFYKGETSEGTGLGLAIVKEIIEIHEGKINIRSKKDSGTEIVIRFPIPKLNRFGTAV